MNRTFCTDLLCTIAFLIWPALGIIWTVVAMNHPQREMVPCDIVNITEIEFQCDGTYGHGPSYCNNEHVVGYQIFVQVNNNSGSFPICEEPKGICNCCVDTEKKCYSVSMLSEVFACKPLQYLPTITNESVCFFAPEEQRVYLRQYDVPYGLVIFWWMIGLVFICVTMFIWCEENFSNYSSSSHCHCCC